MKNLLRFVSAAILLGLFWAYYWSLFHGTTLMCWIMFVLVLADGAYFINSMNDMDKYRKDSE